MPQKKNSSKQTKVSAERNGDKPKNAYFLSLELENVRCFGERQKIDFSNGNDKPRQWTIILGDNGTGKTTILQSLIALTPSPKRVKLETPWNDSWQDPKLADITNLDTWKLFRSPKNQFSLQAKIRLGAIIDFFECDLPESLKVEGTFRRITSSLISESVAQSFFCLAYGASRRAGKTSLSERNDESSYVTLFDETALLINPEEWLLQIDYASKRDSEFKDERANELKLVREILLKVLPDIDEIRFSESENGRTPKPIVEFHTPYGWVESKDLSLGYRTSLAWIIDFASRMFDRYPESENPLAEPAVVLIDEIDLHLHPKWQRELIDYLTNLFPNTQFIVTTHSPLIVQAAAARDANIVVCRREGDHVVIDQSVEAVRGWRADQILTSDLFDLPSTRDTELEKLEKQRREILSKAKLTKADEKKLQKVSAELDSLRVMENLEDDKAMDIIRRAAVHLQNGES